MALSVYYFMIYLVEAFIWAEYVSNIFQPKYPKKLRFLMLSLVYFVLFFVSDFRLVWLNIIFFLLGNFAFIAFLYYSKWQIAFFHAALATAIMSLCELATYHFFSQFSNGEQTLPMLIIWAMISKMGYFTFLFFLSRLNQVKKNNYGHSDKTTILLVGIPIISAVVMFILYSTSKNYNLDITHQWLVSIGSMLLLLMNILMFFIYNHNQKQNTAFFEMQLLMQKEHDSSAYYEMLLKQSESQSILIHDMKRHLQSIGLLNKQQNHEKIDAYILTLTQSPALRSAIRVCDNELLNMVLNRYQKQCLEKGILLQLEIRSCTINFLEDSDLTSLFSNLLDNAVESAENTPNGYIELNIDKRPPSSFTVIHMTNSCNVPPFSNGKTQLISRKKDKAHHGFGMKSVQKIVDKYHGILQTYYKEETVSFHTIIVLKYIE